MAKVGDRMVRGDEVKGLADRLLEPSCLAVFRDVLPNLLPQHELTGCLREHSFLLAEFLVEHSPDYQPARLNRQLMMHGHCHQRALVGMGFEDNLLRKNGADITILDDVDALAAAVASARKTLTRCPSAVELMLQLARRADREQHPRRAENIARRALGDATSSGDRAGRWAAVGELGRIVEKRGLDDEARTMWKEAFAEGSADPVTPALFDGA